MNIHGDHLLEDAKAKQGSECFSFTRQMWWWTEFSTLHAYCLHRGICSWKSPKHVWPGQNILCDPPDKFETIVIMNDIYELEVNATGWQFQAAPVNWNWLFVNNENTLHHDAFQLGLYHDISSFVKLFRSLWKLRRVSLTDSRSSQTWPTIEEAFIKSDCMSQRELKTLFICIRNAIIFTLRRTRSLAPKTVLYWSATF